MRPVAEIMFVDFSGLAMDQIYNQAIVIHPQSAILAVGRINETPMGMPDGSIALRSIMNMILSVDHRCMDGVHAAEFLIDMKAGLENPDFLHRSGNSRHFCKAVVPP